MNRKQFIKNLGRGTGAFVFLTCMGACGSSDSEGDPAPIDNGDDEIDFTFDVTTDNNLVNNGWTIKNGVIIAQSGSAYLAYQSDCTHQGNPLTYNKSSNTFPCSQQGPGHGSVFNANGQRIEGPATRSLKKYNTELNGNNLRIFES